MYWTVDGPIDLDAINDDDDTPEMVAMDSKKDEIMKILRDARAVLCDESHSKYTTTLVTETHPDDIIENASSTSFDTSTTEGAVDVSVVTQIPSFESAVASTSLALSKMYKPERQKKQERTYALVLMLSCLTYVNMASKMMLQSSKHFKNTSHAFRKALK
ncbi:hypothetical protein BCR33DRAFT_471947 [Rhizoclosmatium globosum]|uniref:Uncharacterized protein n=1 Tax=Rhizoclosmatium globosum TaxID=329046 RepID=A0A1Y2BQ27_9FUNG|nr:hypothetical protein BCR33DRAFT_471947 [Rhizoclosmatium globosum]|eukprot:ORY36839.1 hypothetical protein BCR33DRAFT_471947 [Rhizoclosmatium globosum]